MTKRLIAVAVCLVLFYPTATPALGKKKQGKPVQERFSAAAPSISGTTEAMDIAIEEYTSDEEMDGLRKVFEAGGQEALDKVLSKIEKGFYKTKEGFTMPLLIIQSRPEGAGRILQMVGKARSDFAAYGGIVLNAEVKGYPYAFFQLNVDEKGVGTGRAILHGSLAFSKEGHIVAKPSHSGYVPLTNVRLEK